MNYSFLNHLNNNDLNELEKVLLENNSNEELLKQIQMIKNHTIDFTNLDFKSSYIPNYDQNLEKKCTKILKQLKANDLFFFLNGFQNKGNTKYCYLYGVPAFYKNFEDKNIFRDLNILIDIACGVYQYYNSDSNTEPILNLDRVDNIFKYNLFQKDFEGPYNMLNYIKNYIYLLLEHDKKITTKDVFKDYLAKRELVTIQIRDISSYLCEIRNGTNLRLCIANAGLSRTANKTGKQFNVQQSLFIDALAFGTTLGKIENRDYEDYKKLLYLPTGKNLKK